jgi:uncharacterized protein Yka (UPF0111/DUF47 family)
MGTAQHDYLKDGFFAKTPAEEIKSNDLEINVLDSIEDVTAAVNSAVAPEMTGEQAAAARKAERTVEKAYRRAIAELFQGDDYLNMFKRRETYRHLSNAADRVSDAAHSLDNIVVKLC